MSWLAHTSITSVRQFDRSDLDAIFTLADTMREHPQTYQDLAHGKLLATLFYEPSTRTRLSFEAAMARLGGRIISTENAAEMSSAVKGETLADTIRIVSGYTDVIALRHFDAGASDVAAEASSVPVINAGDGAGEHPTQALLDAYTIRDQRGRMDELTLTFVGDLAYGRTVHSLSILLTNFPNVTVHYVAPDLLQAPSWLVTFLKTRGVHVLTDDRLDARVLESTDILYVTRIQKERFPSGVRHEDTSYRVDASVLHALSPHAYIMHPLPRVQELPAEVDRDPRAIYFLQARLGMWIRMALLARALTLA